MTKHMFQVARWWGAGRVASSVRVLERRAAASFVAAVAALGAASAAAVGQGAPAGNEHPRSEMVTRSDGPSDIAFPFGPMIAEGASPTPEHKARFAAEVDLTPLLDVAVHHQGRVKILDTLAGETVRRVTGRRHYEDIIPLDASAASRRVVKHPTLFTLIDLIIDPRYYFDKPLVGVEYLPLRRLIIEGAFPGDARDAHQRRDWWLRVGRVTPRMVQDHVPLIAERHAFEPAYNRALSDLDHAITLWVSSASNMMLVAPASTDAPWKHVSSLAMEHPARRAAMELGAAWRAQDAAGVNAAAARLAEELPRINASVYPAARRELERAYNASRPFELGYWAYLLATLFLLLSFGTGRPWLGWAGLVALAGAVGLHGFGFVSRCLIAERFAIQNQFESMTGISLFAAIVGLTLMLVRRQWIFGAAAAGVGFLVLVTASTTGIPGVRIEREAAILNTSVLLKYHVTTVLVSYGLISLGFIISLFYLGTYYLAPRTGGAVSGAGG
ncbi:MAG: hypothetical protein JNK70_12635, partial [Phycisphaerae bacterium]|nr:hypothetical protein [Phycisphaerae bacterium]